MALSGSKTVTVGSYWNLVLEWNATQNISNNTSSVTARLYWQANAGVGVVNSSTNKTASITIDGTTTSVTTNATLSAGQKKLIHTYTKNVTHTGDGSKTLAISGTFGMEVTLSGTYYSSKTVSGSWALDSIARASTFTISDMYIYAGEGATVTIKEAVSAFTHTVYYKFGTYTGTIATRTTALSVPFTTRLEDLSMIPNANYGNADMYVDTYNGTTLVGSRKLTFSIYTPTTITPLISSFVASDNNSTISTLMGVGNYVQGFSDLRFTASATGQYGATIKSYGVVFNGQSSTASTWNYGVIGKFGTIPATLTVTDSRGLSNSSVINVVVIPYASPTISSFTARRNATTNTTVNTSYSVGISALNVGSVAKNTISARVEYKLRTATTWTLVGTYLTATSSPSVTGMSTSLSYDYRLVLSDKLTSNIISTASISTTAVLVDLAKNGVGFGKMWEQGAIDVAGDISLNGSVSTSAGMVIKTPSGTGTLGASNSSHFHLNTTLPSFYFWKPTIMNGQLDVLGDITVSGEIIGQQPRQALSLSSGFTNNGSPYLGASYWKDKNGIVHVSGLIKGGTNALNQPVALLPEGYRPSNGHLTFTVMTNNTTSSLRINVNSTGVITLGGLYTTYVSLSGISFKAE